MISRSRSNAPTGETLLPIPDNIGRYQVIDRLATGGMAEVFICLERQLAGLERLVVVKRILPHLAIHQSFVDMFLSEARYVARINHPNVVQIHELGEDNGTPFLSMEYIAGCSLRDLLVAAIEAGKPLPVGVAVSLAAQACAGAHAAHELTDSQGRPLGLVHRDISPHNLMLTAEGHVKLLDFGIAKATEAAGIEHTRTGALKGKVHYMAPEQCKQEPLDRRADVFALGIVAWELLASERLFKRDSELAAMQAIVGGELKDLRAIRRDVPTVVVAAIEKALTPKKEARFQTAEAMKRAIQEAARGADTSAEHVAAFLKPLLGEQLEARRQGFLAAAREPRRASMQPQRTGSFSLSLHEEGDSTVVDKPSNDRGLHPTIDGREGVEGPIAATQTVRPMGVGDDARSGPGANSADEHGDDHGDDFDDLADMETVRQRGFPVEGPRDAQDTNGTSPSLPSLPSLPVEPRRRSWLLPAAVTLLTCAIATAVLLVPRLRGPAVSGPPLVIMWPPTVAPEKLETELSDLAMALQRRTHRPVQIDVAASYDDVVAALTSGRAAFGVLPPYLFVTARQEVPGLVPLASKLVDGSSGSDGVLLVREDSDVHSVADLKGHTFCFPDQKSTTGYILARAKLREAGLDPAVDIKAHLSGNHTQVLRDLNAGVCDAGATYSGGYLAADRAGIPVGQARVLMITGRSPQDMIVSGPTTTADDANLMRRALLDFDPKKEFGRATVGVLERISGFAEPKMSEYEALERAANVDREPSP